MKLDIHEAERESSSLLALALPALWPDAREAGPVRAAPPVCGRPAAYLLANLSGSRCCTQLAELAARPMCARAIKVRACAS